MRQGNQDNQGSQSIQADHNNQTSQSSQSSQSRQVSPFWQVWVLYRKEMLELVRNYKLVWVPAIFVLLGAMQPVMMYYLPDILASAGNLPPGSVIEIPAPSAGEVLGQVLSQYNTIGLLVIALAWMGAISGERQSGLVSIILAKPVSYGAFVAAKWAAMLTLVALSLAAGYLAAWYYTEVLIGHAAPKLVISSLLMYGVWLAFIGTLAILASALVRSGAAAAFLALGTAALLSVAASLWPAALAWNPAMLATRATALVATGHSTASAWGAAAIAVLSILAALVGAAWHVRRRPETAQL